MFLVAADKDEKALSGCNDVALTERWIAHGPRGGFHFLLIGGNRGPGAGACDKFLRPAARFIHALLPLFHA